MANFDANLLALHYVYPVALNRLQPLLQVDPALDGILYMTPSELAKYLKLNVDQAAKIQENFRKVSAINWTEFYAEQHIIPLTFYAKSYPSALLEVYDPPAVLYCRGDISLLENDKKLAVIGSRHATFYTEKCLRNILPELLARNIVIVSGLARGADSIAHKITMELGGKTIAVLGNGLNYVYPRENSKLQKNMENSQLVVSEFPPYMQPAKWRFPLRNRLISGMSSAIVVTESKIKSGTMSTVDYGLNHGKNIFSIPGDVFSAYSEGPNQLIREGATPIWQAQQIIKEMQGF